jgi:hypothetical protein
MLGAHKKPTMAVGLFGASLGIIYLLRSHPD